MSFEIAARRDAGPRRRVGLRQVDDRAGDPAALRADRGARSSSTGSDIARLEGGALRALRPRMQMIFQDPQASLNPRMTVGLDHRRAARRACRARPRRAAGAGDGADGRGRAEPRLRQPLSARVLRRPAAADRHRPGAGAEPEVHRLRRADRRARRLDPGAGGEPARGPAGEVRADLSLHQPRPVDGAPPRDAGSR